MNKLLIFITIFFITLNFTQPQTHIGVGISYPLNDEVILKLSDPSYLNFFGNYKFELLETDVYYQDYIDIYQLQLVLADSINFKGDMIISTSDKLYFISLPELRQRLNTGE